MRKIAIYALIIPILHLASTNDLFAQSCSFQTYQPLIPVTLCSTGVPLSGMSKFYDNDGMIYTGNCNMGNSFMGYRSGSYVYQVTGVGDCDKEPTPELCEMIPNDPKCQTGPSEPTVCEKLKSYFDPPPDDCDFSVKFWAECKAGDGSTLGYCQNFKHNPSGRIVPGNCVGELGPPNAQCTLELNICKNSQPGADDDDCGFYPVPPTTEPCNPTLPGADCTVSTVPEDGDIADCERVNGQWVCGDGKDNTECMDVGGGKIVCAGNTENNETETECDELKNGTWYCRNVGGGNTGGGDNGGGDNGGGDNGGGDNGGGDNGGGDNGGGDGPGGGTGTGTGMGGQGDYSNPCTRNPDGTWNCVGGGTIGAPGGTGGENAQCTIGEDGSIVCEGSGGVKDDESLNRLKGVFTGMKDTIMSHPALQELMQRRFLQLYSPICYLSYRPTALPGQFFEWNFCTYEEYLQTAGNVLLMVTIMAGTFYLFRA